MNHFNLIFLLYSCLISLSLSLILQVCVCVFRFIFLPNLPRLPISTTLGSIATSDFRCPSLCLFFIYGHHILLLSLVVKKNTKQTRRRRFFFFSQVLFVFFFFIFFHLPHSLVVESPRAAKYSPTPLIPLSTCLRVSAWFSMQTFDVHHRLLLRRRGSTRRQCRSWSHNYYILIYTYTGVYILFTYICSMSP